MAVSLVITIYQNPTILMTFMDLFNREPNYICGGGGA